MSWPGSIRWIACVACVRAKWNRNSGPIDANMPAFFCRPWGRIDHEGHRAARRRHAKLIRMVTRTSLTGENPDVPRMAVIGDGEIVLLKSMDWAPGCVADQDLQLHRAGDRFQDDGIGRRIGRLLLRGGGQECLQGKCGNRGAEAHSVDRNSFCACARRAWQSAWRPRRPRLRSTPPAGFPVPGASV